MTLTKWIKENAAALLSAAGAMGVAATAVLTAKAVPKADDAIWLARQEAIARDERPTWRETVLPAVPAYLPAIAMGAGTIGCILGANALSRRQQAALTSAYAALEAAFQTYRERAAMLGGSELDRAIADADERERADREDDNPPWDETQTFYLSCAEKPIFFERTMEEIMAAEYCINRNFVLRGNVTLNELLAFLRLEPVEDGENIGWDQYIGESLYGYSWIDFVHRHYTTDDGLTICAIDTPFPPHSLSEGVDE